MKKNLLSLCCLMLLLCAYAQQPIDFDNFKPLMSKGILPPEISMSGKDFIESSREVVMSEGGRKNKKAKKQFLLVSSYSVRELFISGRILYNDPISEYVEKVRKLVTAKDATLQSETKVFVIKSTVVNAFTTNQGYVFITTGLLSQLENEAQLAFVICHELIHYKNKHVLRGYIANEAVDRNNGAYRKSSVDKNLSKSNFSKENEIEADKEGFDMFFQAGYDVEAVNSAFDVLKYSELPFDEVEFKTDLLETEFLKLPPSYVKEEIEVPEGEEENRDDEYSTHPNLQTRRLEIKDRISALGSKKDSNSKLYIISESEFIQVQKLARFDICHTNLIARNYDRAMYEAYCLLQEDPNNLYLKKIILKSLYGLTKYKYNGRLSEVNNNWKRVEGESQRLNYLMDQLTTSELNVVAVNYAWRLKKSLAKPDDAVDKITEDLFKDMVENHYNDREYFATETAAVRAVKDSLNELENTEKNTKSSKASKIKRKQKKVAEGESFTVYAFIDLLKDSDFVRTYDRLAKRGNYNEVELQGMASRHQTKQRSQNANNKFYNEKKDCYALGLDKLLIINPFYLRIDERKLDAPVLYVSTDNAQKKFNDNINSIASQVGLGIEMLDKQELTTDKVEEYNDIAVLINWLDERIDHKDIEMIPTDFEQIENIAKKYGSDNLALTGTISFIEKKYGIGGNILLSIMFPVVSWPYSIPYLATKSKRTYVYTIIYNMKTGKREMLKVGNVNFGDKDDVIKAFLYDFFMQAKRTGAKKNK